MLSEQIHVNDMGDRVECTLATEPQEGHSSVWLRPLGLVDQRAPHPFPCLEDHFVRE